MGVDSLELQPSTPEVQLPGVSSPSSCGVADSDWWELQDSRPEAVHTGQGGRVWACHQSRSVADKATLVVLSATNLQLVLFPESGEYELT